MRWLVLSDIQYPDQDRAAIRSVLRFIDKYQPDGLLCVGDELDSPEASRWSKGWAAEFAGTLKKSLDGCHDMLADFREALGPSKPFHLMRSNHGERVRTYLRRYAPAVESLPQLQYEALLRLDELDITYHGQPFEFAPGWMLAHGDEGSMTQTPGGTALSLAKKWGKSVVSGHTHRAGLQHHHQYVNGKPSSLLFGVEVGHLMDLRKADYLKAGSANWQQAVGLIEVDGKRVQPTLVPIFNSTVQYQGVTF